MRRGLPSFPLMYMEHLPEDLVHCMCYICTGYIVFGSMTDSSQEQKDDLFFFFYPHVFFLSPAGRMVKPVYLDIWTTLLLGLFDDFLVYLKKKKRKKKLPGIQKKFLTQFSTLV